MTAASDVTDTDLDFVARARAALDHEVRGFLAEDEDVWRRLQHRRLAERVKALVAFWRTTGDPGPLGPALVLAGLLRERQNPSGLFRGGDNVDSPPDSAFSVNDLADAAWLLRTPASPAARLPGALAESADLAPGDDAGSAVRKLADALEQLLAAVTPALVKGGVHTPNHRWELSAALARLHRLDRRADLAARVEQWLAEGIDIEDGLYSERSANYAAHVSNPSLLTIADVFDRPGLVDIVEENLTATLDLLLPDGTVETVLSRRQDQRASVPLGAYLIPLRTLAALRGRSDLAWAAGVALDQGIGSPGTVMTALLLNPDVGRMLPPPMPPASPRLRHFAAAGTVVAHHPGVTAVVFGGSDHAEHGRIRSGLANSPTFLRLHAGAAVLDSVRLSRTFFGLGPFRSHGLALESDVGLALESDVGLALESDAGSDASPARAGGEGLLSEASAGQEPGKGPVAVLAETVSAAYYQPLGVADRDDRGRYRLGDDGRFSAAMDFGRRARDEVTLTTDVRVTLTETGADLAVDVSGAIVDWSLELAFRPGERHNGSPEHRQGGHSEGSRGPRGGGRPEPGGTLTGAEALGDGRWRLESGTATYRVGDDQLSVTVLEGPATSAETGPGYHPGEDYEFLGGTDAAGGVRLYVTGKAPARLRLRIAAGVN